MLLLALILILLFGGVGFFAHVVWWGLILGGVLLVASYVSGGRV